MTKAGRLSILFFILAIVGIIPAMSQSNSLIKFRNYGIGDGLSMSTVFDIAQTPNGYMWFATGDGLNRFDGYSFKVFKRISGKENSLVDNYVTALEVDANGDLWIGSNSGEICIYDISRSEIIRLKGFNNLTSKTDAKILDLKYDQRGQMWIATEGAGLYKYDVYSKKYEHFNTDNSALNSDNIVCVEIHDKQNVWVGTTNGLNYIHFNSNEVAGEDYLQGEIVEDILFEGDTLYIATTESGLYRFGKSLDSIPISRNGKNFSLLSTMIEDGRGNYWFGSYSDGLINTNFSTVYTEVSNDQGDEFSLINNAVFCSYVDDDGNVWIGTLSGVSVYCPMLQQFGLIHSSRGSLNGLSDNNVYNLYEDDYGYIWICTYQGGLNKLDPKNGNISTFNYDNSTGLETNNVRVICQEGEGKYWVGTGTHGLFLFDENSRSFTSVLSEFNMEYVRHIVKTSETDLWIGCERGLVYYNVEQDSGEWIIEDDFKSVYQMEHMKGTNTMWVASFGNGLIEFDYKNRKILNSYLNDGLDTNSIGNDNVMCIQSLSNDTLIVGTFGGGFSIFDLSSREFTTISEQDGLPNDAIYGLLIDKNRNVWFSSNKGLCRYSLRDGSIKSFDQLSQVQSLEFNEGAFLTTSTGMMYFGGINGVNFFDPNQIQRDNSAPKILISNVKVFEEDYPFQNEVLLNGVLELTHNNNFVGFEFVAINYANPEKSQYRYMLEGVDDDWVNVGNKRYAKYTNLDPGSYVFKVSAANDDGVWTTTEASLLVVIKTPYWLSWWFIGLMALVVISIVGFLLFQRTQSIRKSYKLKMLDVELMALRSQMNPHFIFNSINSIQYYILNKNPKSAYKYLSKFSSLMRLILNNSRVNFITLSEEVEALELYIQLEKMRLEDELEYSIHIEEGIEPRKLLIPSMIIQPYVENAILHGLAPKEKDRALNIKLSRDGDLIHCLIEDNGIGREKAKELNAKRTRKHKSTGMKVTKGRLELLNQENYLNLSVNISDLANGQDHSNGTRVEIFIPLKENLKDD
jgi:ligand-binding sensor domain-containing protein